MPNDILRKVKEKFVCPTHRVPLHYDEAFMAIDRAPWPDGEISCSQGCQWNIRGGIPRFVHGDNYALSFGLQWNRFPRTELDSSTGKPYSRERLERCLAAPLETLSDKTVLECGAGAGRFTE